MSKAKGGLTVQAMKDEIQGFFSELGVDFKFDADKDLSGFSRGPALRLGALKALPDGSIVWAWYKEHGEARPRIDQAMRISRNQDGSWGLEDGSSFAAEFTPTGDYDHGSGRFSTPSDDAECFDEGGGEGEMRLYEAARRTAARPKARRAGRRRA